MKGKESEKESGEEKGKKGNREKDEVNGER
jgi:hypothetical protein